MVAVVCDEAASLPVKMLAKVHQDLHQVSLYPYLPHENLDPLAPPNPPRRVRAERQREALRGERR